MEDKREFQGADRAHVSELQKEHPISEFNLVL